MTDARESLFDDLSDAVVPPPGVAVLVLAGNYEQAQKWARRMRLAPHEWKLVTPNSARGRLRPFVYLVGSWYTRDDLRVIEAALFPTSPRVMRGEDLLDG